MLELRACVVLFLLCAVTALRQNSVHKATVYWDPGSKTVLLKDGVLDDTGDAYGFYNDSFSETGWGVLEVRAGYGHTPRTDDKTFFLAGYLEGFLTAQQMIDHYTNLYPQLITRPNVLKAVKSFMTKQNDWSRQQVKQNRTSDPLWAHTGFILAQLDGLQAGAAEWAKRSGKKALSQFEVQFLNAVGDLLDLIQMLVPEAKPSLRGLREPPMGHCSALIKMLPGYENLLFAHSSWYVYAATMRIFKHWDFKIQEPHTATGKLSFSSYPGFLVSLDDFYLLGSGLMMTQTTNNIFNQSLYEVVTSSSLFAWQRVRLAHALAHSGREWAEIFSRFNSGTYNNQYMVLDVSKVSLGSRLEDGALTIVEQIPGLVESSDQTETLRFGYWPSYNVPFHQRIYSLSGYEEMWREYGEDYSYELCPRAKIFRRDQASVTDLLSLKHIMRSNDYKKDPYSKGDPCKSICCRGDLRTSNPVPEGCYDTKVSQVMEKQQCAPGFIWYSLVKDCISHDALNPVTEAVVVPPVPCWNTTVWISVCVVAVLSCSVLVLLLWVIIYRRHTHGNRNSECPASHHHNLKNSLNKEDSCPHINGRKQEVPDCEMDWMRSFCKAGVESAVPLPATELGDSALVTTKTVQLV